MSNADYSAKQKLLFNFLVGEYGYKLLEDYRGACTFVTTYIKNDIRISMDFDIKDNFFYFKLIKGRDTLFPNDSDRKNIIPFFRLFEKYDPYFDPNSIQPDDHQYEEALRLNAELLKKYGDKVLKGEEWIKSKYPNK